MNDRPHLYDVPRGADPDVGFVHPANIEIGAVDIRRSNGGVAIARRDGAATSLALSHLRALVIVTVLAFHSVLAYLGSLGATAFAFDVPPYKWRAFPIVDSQRWFGFDIFCAWQDVYLMSLMFFLSALFTWPSLKRKGGWKFLSDRLLRLGVPFVFAVTVVMPIALYPVYRVTATDPSLAAYARHLLALPFWPNGPMWFLWLLLAFTIVAVGLREFASNWVERLGWLSSSAGARPGRYFMGLVTASALAYVPLALIFTPWDWSDHGLFALQLSRPLHYAVYYFAGLGVGAYGLERGLLAADGQLARRWAVWLAGALAAFLLWMGLTALVIWDTVSAPLGLRVAVDLGFVLACASGGFSVVAVCLRFATLPSRILTSLANNAFGMYLLHYVFVVWLQYALLDVALFAFAKAMIVLGGALLFAWTASIGMRLVPFGSRLIGAERLVLTKGLLSGGATAGAGIGHGDRSLAFGHRLPGGRRVFSLSSRAGQRR